jgi:methyl-accepting chemotaxis protein
MSTPVPKRRRILIESFQYRLLAIHLVYFATILLIFAGTLFLPIILELRSGTLSVIEQGEVAGLFLSLHARVWPAMLVVFALLTLHSVLVSHRIAGPLYRFRTVFKAVTQGDLSVRANLRKTDYLEKESDSLNEMIMSLRTRLTEIKKHSEEVEAGIVGLREMVERGSVKEARQQIADLQAQTERLKESIAHFRLHPDQERGEDPSKPTVVPAAASEESVRPPGA